ncbi:hypothetical protein AB0E01_35495 [Nocardia vinacea]|uniref:hypothetical protein n=1 Tax=Nocardia vinacea TaxID=96468 RepID=UPI0033CAF11E
MATRKVTVTLPEELLESIKGRVAGRKVSAYIAAAVEHQDALDRLRELSDRLEKEYGPVTDDAYQAALDRLDRLDAWHAERHGPGNAA